LGLVKFFAAFFSSFLKYDRSGRSSGVAVVTFETADEATRAKKEYDGIKAKGDYHQPGFLFIYFIFPLFLAYIHGQLFFCFV
jgi:RNA recognition motif-containing protein